MGRVVFPAMTSRYALLLARARSGAGIDGAVPGRRQAGVILGGFPGQFRHRVPDLSAYAPRMRVPLLRADTMTARYISPELRARIYSVRFFVGFLGSAAAAPVVSIFYERNGSVAAVTMVLAVFCVVTLGCALFFPNRKEELEPELWADALPAAAE